MTLPRLVWRFVLPYWPWLLGLGALQALQALAQLEVPTLLGDVVDRSLRGSSAGTVWPPAVAMLVLSLLSAAVSVGALYCGSRAALGLARDLRASLFTRILGWSAREHALFGAASLTTRLTNDVQQLQLLVGSAAGVVLLTPLTVTGGIILALRQDAAMGHVLLVAVPAMVGVMSLLLIRMVKVATVQQAQVEGLNGVAREQITGLRVVRAFVREAHEASSVMAIQYAALPICQRCPQAMLRVGSPSQARSTTGPFVAR